MQRLSRWWRGELSDELKDQPKDEQPSLTSGAKIISQMGIQKDEGPNKSKPEIEPDIEIEEFELLGSRRLPPPNLTDGPIRKVNFEDIEINKKVEPITTATHIDFGTFREKKFDDTTKQEKEIGIQKDGIIKHSKGDMIKLILEPYFNFFAGLAHVWGVAPTFLTYDKDNNPICLCSEKIPNFQTYRNGPPLTAEQLQDPVFAKKMLDMMIIDLFGEEDDDHINNISRELYLFDKDWWFATVLVEEITGGREYVDSIRNIRAAFALCENRLVTFPTLPCDPKSPFDHPWYAPYIDTELGSVLSIFTNNIYPVAHTQLVRERFTGKPETQQLLFRRAVDWITDVIPRIGPTARLFIPEKLETVEKKNVLSIIEQFQERKMAEFYNGFLYWEAFYSELAKSRDEIVLEVLIRSMVRDGRLEHQKTYCPASRYPHVDAAKIGANRVIDNVNTLVERMNAQLLSFTVKPDTTEVSEANGAKEKAELEPIPDELRGKLIAKASRIAAKLIVLEEKIGSLPWEQFHALQTQLLKEEAELEPKLGPKQKFTVEIFGQSTDKKVVDIGESIVNNDYQPLRPT